VGAFGLRSRVFTRVLSGSLDVAAGVRGGAPGEGVVAPLERAAAGVVEGGGVEPVEVEGVEVEGIDVEGVEVEGAGVEGDAEVGELAGLVSTGSPDPGPAALGLFG
jgi:hypothetical protein